MISVCIATYNGERYIRKQIDSILCQLSVDDEIIISDDGSEDKTIEILEEYGDDRIKIFHHKKDMSLAKLDKASFYFATQNFENALIHAKGDYIFLSDQDDEWLPNKVEKMLSILKHHYAVMSNCQVINSVGKILQPSFRTKKPFTRCFFSNLLVMPFLGCCMAFRKEVLQYSLPFPKRLLAHDFWLGSMAVRKFDLVYIDDVLHSYRQHDENVSSASSNKSRNTLLFKIKYRMKFLFQYIAK